MSAFTKYASKKLLAQRLFEKLAAGPMVVEMTAKEMAKAVQKWLAKKGLSSVPRVAPDPAIARAANALNQAKGKGAGRFGSGTHRKGKGTATAEIDLSGFPRTRNLRGK